VGDVPRSTGFALRADNDAQANIGVSVSGNIQR
jgi:hypothetical protein